MLNAQKGLYKHRKHCIAHKKGQDHKRMYALVHIIHHCQTAPYMRLKGVALMPDNFR